MVQGDAVFRPTANRDRRPDREVDQGAGKANYKHEDLFDIAEAITPALSRHGLSYRYRATSKRPCDRSGNSFRKVSANARDHR